MLLGQVKISYNNSLFRTQNYLCI